MWLLLGGRLAAGADPRKTHPSQCAKNSRSLPWRLLVYHAEMMLTVTIVHTTLMMLNVRSPGANPNTNRSVVQIFWWPAPSSSPKSMLAYCQSESQGRRPCCPWSSPPGPSLWPVAVPGERALLLVRDRSMLLRAALNDNTTKRAKFRPREFQTTESFTSLLLFFLLLFFPFKYGPRYCR